MSGGCNPSASGSLWHSVGACGPSAPASALSGTNCSWNHQRAFATNTKEPRAIKKLVMMERRRGEGFEDEKELRRGEEKR
jgi:hypothetical protein